MNGILAMLQFIREMADHQSRISTAATSGELKSGTTATEAADLSEMRRQAEDQYTGFVSLTLQKLWKFMFELLVAHFDELKAVCGEAIPIDSVEQIVNAKLSFEVNGKASGNSPAATLAKVDRAMQYAMAYNGSLVDQLTGQPKLDPGTGLPVQPIDITELVRLALQALSLPMSIEKIMPKTQENAIDNAGPPEELVQQLLMALSGGAMEEGAPEPYGEPGELNQAG
jgi:hypothetical protein